MADSVIVFEGLDDFDMKMGPGEIPEIVTPSPVTHFAPVIINPPGRFRTPQPQAVATLAGTGEIPRPVWVIGGLLLSLWLLRRGGVF